MVRMLTWFALVSAAIVLAAIYLGIVKSVIPGGGAGAIITVGIVGVIAGLQGRRSIRRKLREAASDSGETTQTA